MHCNSEPLSKDAFSLSKSESSPKPKPDKIQSSLLMTISALDHSRWTEEKIEAECAALIEWMTDPTSYFLLNFFLSRGYSRSTGEFIASKSPTFKRLMEVANDIQESRLVDKAVHRKGDSSFIKFILQNKNSYKETTETKHSINPVAEIMSIIEQNPIEVKPTSYPGSPALRELEPPSTT